MQDLNKQSDWEEKTNAAYQDGMKTVLSLATASLVLPIVLVRTFAVGGTPKDHLTRRAYISWFLLFLSILACLVFFYCSAKYLKLVSGGSESGLSESQYEAVRDCACGFSIACFLAGILWSFLFLRTLVATKPSMVSQSSGGDRP